MKLDDPLGSILREWQKWRLTNATPLLKYKRIVLELAKARQFGTLMYLLPPAVTQSIAPSQTASGSLPEAAAVAEPAVDKDKTKAKPEPRLGRRKSMRVLERQSEATVEASTENIAAKLVNSAERSHTKTALVRQVAQEPLKEAAPSNAFEQEVVTSDAMSDDENDLDSLSRFMQDLFLAPTNIKGSRKEGETLPQSVEHDIQETTGRNSERKQTRPRRSTLCTVASNGSPMPDVPVLSSPFTPTITTVSGSSFESSSELTSRLQPDQVAEYKENATVVEVKTDTKPTLHKEGPRRRKSTISLGVIDWLPDLYLPY